MAVASYGCSVFRSQLGKPVSFLLEFLFRYTTNSPFQKKIQSETRGAVLNADCFKKVKTRASAMSVLNQTQSSFMERKIRGWFGLASILTLNSQWSEFPSGNKTSVGAFFRARYEEEFNKLCLMSYCFRDAGGYFNDLS